MSKAEEKRFSLDDIAKFLHLGGSATYYDANEMFQRIAVSLLACGEFTKAELRPLFERHGFTIPHRFICPQCKIDDDEKTMSCSYCTRIHHAKEECVCSCVAKRKQ